MHGLNSNGFTPHFNLDSLLEGNLYLHLSDGTQFTSTTISTPNRWGESSSFNWAGDFNGDRKIDLLSRLPKSSETVMRLAKGTAFDVTEWNATGYLRPQTQ